MWREPAREIKEIFLRSNVVGQNMALKSPVTQVLALMSAEQVYGFSLMSAKS